MLVFDFGELCKKLKKSKSKELSTTYIQTLKLIDEKKMLKKLQL